VSLFFILHLFWVLSISFSTFLWSTLSTVTIYVLTHLSFQGILLSILKIIIYVKFNIIINLDFPDCITTILDICQNPESLNQLMTYNDETLMTYLKGLQLLLSGSKFLMKLIC
jgi:hypothetical protein